MTTRGHLSSVPGVGQAAGWRRGNDGAVAGNDMVSQHADTECGCIYHRMATGADVGPLLAATAEPPPHGAIAMRRCLGEYESARDRGDAAAALLLAERLHRLSGTVMSQATLRVRRQHALAAKKSS